MSGAPMTNAEMIERARAMRMDSEIGTPVERIRMLGELANALQSAQSVIDAVDAWQRSPYAGDAEGGIRWTALRGILRDRTSTGYDPHPEDSCSSCRYRFGHAPDCISRGTGS